MHRMTKITQIAHCTFQPPQIVLRNSGIVSLFFCLRPREHLLDQRAPLGLNDFISVRAEQPALEEGRDVVDLQLFRPRFELVDWNLDRRRVIASLMSVQLDFLLDNLAKEERNELFVICRLVDVFSEALWISLCTLYIHSHDTGIWTKCSERLDSPSRASS